MPAPVSSFGAPGNLLGGASGLSVSPGQTPAGILDIASAGNAAIEAKVCCEALTGATAPTAGTVFAAYRIYGNSAPITLSAAASAGASSLAVSSAAGLRPGAMIALEKAGGGQAELVTIATSYAIGNTTVPLNAGTLYAYSTGDSLFLLVQSTPRLAGPIPSTGIDPNTPYSADITVGVGQYAVVAAPDPASGHPVVVTITADELPRSFA